MGPVWLSVTTLHRAADLKGSVPQPHQIGRGLAGNCGCWRWPKPVAAEVGIPQVRPQLAPPRS